jgi:hypothetical protein
MRAIGLVSVSFVMTPLLATDAKSANNRWCAVSPKKSENCGYATLDQCRAQVLGLGGLVPTESLPRNGVWDQRHLVVRPTAPPRRVLGVRPQDSNRPCHEEASWRPSSARHTVVSKGAVWRASQKTEVAHFVEHADAKGDPDLGGSYADTGRLRHIRRLI